MIALEAKIDAMARIILAETEGDRDSARSDLKNLLKKSRSRSQTELIHGVLKELGVPYGNLGHDYLVTAVKMVLEDPGLINNITKSNGLYYKVAKEADTQPNRVERAIRHVIECMWNRGDWDILQHHFGNTVDPNKGKPTNTEAISCIAAIVRFRMEQGG